ASGAWVGGINQLLNRSIAKAGKKNDYDVDTFSVSVMDTIDLSDSWTLHLGLRADRFDYSNITADRGAPTFTTWEYSDTLWNGNVGLVYTLNEQGNVYLNYSTATNINGGESDVGANCGYGGLCGSVGIVKDSKPEELENIELGTKWDLFNNKLLLTAAVFQITKDKVMESQSGFDYDTNGFLNSGENRVEGVEISAAGNITDDLSVVFGAALMNAKVRDSYDPANIGKTLANFADKSAYLQLRYQLTDAFAMGAAATYSSDVYTGQPDSAANENLGVPSYTVYDLFASYQVNDDLSLRLNVNNVTDKDYYFTAYRSGSFTYIGDARSAQLTVSYSF
ncbi:MAG: TonB-dependent receptor, partial [Spongiibacteraceae bacterium]|nr:TonB-dependent receptor [Spongiibacteraceae bacterium]